MYKSTFKDLKRKCPPPDYSSVLDFDNIDVCCADVIKLSSIPDIEPNDDDAFLLTQIKPTVEWEVFELKGKPGLLFVRNPFNWIGQRYWICRCLQDFPQKPNRLNLDAHNELKPEEDWWETSLGKDNRSTALRKRLRWATMGYHHDWNTKVYSETARDPFPSDLASLSRFVAKVVGLPELFEAQAAIVNYYHLDSTLSGHTDHSEEYATAPLLSFSFGQTAIFLLGGQSLNDVPTPMYVRSGDIIIMSGYSRLCYHGIPKILKSTNSPWEPETALSESSKNDLDPRLEESNHNSRIRTNIEPTSDSVHNSSIEVKQNLSPKSKKRKLEVNNRSINPPHKIDCSSTEHLCNDKLWLPFKTYVKSSRINMNVRQVLYAGQTVLQSREPLQDVDNRS